MDSLIQVLFGSRKTKRRTKREGLVQWHDQNPLLEAALSTALQSLRKSLLESPKGPCCYHSNKG